MRIGNFLINVNSQSEMNVTIVNHCCAIPAWCRVSRSMSPVTHFLTGWILANVTPLNRREKTAVVCAAVVPDLDGLGAIPEILTRTSAHPLHWFSDYHHSLHTLAFAVMVTLATL